MKGHRDVILDAASRIAAGVLPDYRDRLQLERSIFQVTCMRARRRLGWKLVSMSRVARREIGERCDALGLSTESGEMRGVYLGFDAMDLLTSVSQADPYIVNERIFGIANCYSEGIESLPLTLREFVGG